MIFIDKYIRKVGLYVPFYSSNTISRSIGNEGHRILDVGCGWGKPIEPWLGQDSHYIVGLDIFLPYLKQAKLNGTYSEYVLCDIRKLPFKPKSFDIVLCMEVVEHMEKYDALKAIKEIEKIARKRVIITTPVGFFEQEQYHGNPLQEHKSGFYPNDFKKRGYTVRGAGVKICRLLTSPQSVLQKLMRRVLRVFFSPFSYYIPLLAEKMICIKFLTRNSK